MRLIWLIKIFRLRSSFYEFIFFKICLDEKCKFAYLYNMDINIQQKPLNTMFLILWVNKQLYLFLSCGFLNNLWITINMHVLQLMFRIYFDDNVILKKQKSVPWNKGLNSIKDKKKKGGVIKTQIFISSYKISYLHMPIIRLEKSLNFIF